MHPCFQQLLWQLPLPGSMVSPMPFGNILIISFCIHAIPGTAWVPDCAQGSFNEMRRFETMPQHNLRLLAPEYAYLEHVLNMQHQKLP